MSFLPSIRSFRLANSDMNTTSTLAEATFSILKRGTELPPHSSHPSFGHLILLVFEAVLEVVCVSLPGYIIARQGMFDAEMQKFVANLNVQLFTPCLIFTKLASQLTAGKLAELGVIPFIFVVQILVSFLCSRGVSKLFGFKKRPTNFVVAMGVFGNSNSLPISLVLSLSKTLKGLHWDKVPGDNDDEVAARGILYLMIFQQLGQLVRWTWGYHVLLAPADKYIEEDQHTNSRIEQGEGHYYDDPEAENEPNILLDYSDDEETHRQADVEDTEGTLGESEFDSTSQTPVLRQGYLSSVSSKVSLNEDGRAALQAPTLLIPPDRNLLPHSRSDGHITEFPTLHSTHNFQVSKGWLPRAKSAILARKDRSLEVISECSDKVFSVLPQPVQTCSSKVWAWICRFAHGLWEFMNPPLWAMLSAIVIASIPSLQRAFFSEGTFIRNSVTSAISQSGGVAVPLILVVLGANLARNTLPENEFQETIEEKREEKKLLIAALVSRMLLPTLVMAPILALIAKYVPVSILDDPIFVIVCFLLTGAPSALQLAQICQINNVYMGAMSKLLFQSYVVWILPSTLMLVMCALEVVEWAAT
ncbi:MAG: hypothetical protein M1834_000164 [Cirrosporium novae-zelandiae]|nr:MAG: hypothetical protein M1834_000164 [Cirrosporium novae-zelandiae]